MRPFSEWTKIIGHRGASGTTPENTLNSIREAHEIGSRAVHFDVRLSKDNVPVLMADATLERTTNGSGYIWDHDFEQLKKLDAGSWFLPQFAGEPIPTLEEALRLAASLEMRVAPQLKPQPGKEREMTQIVLDMIQRLWPFEQSLPLINSSSVEVVEMTLQTFPAWPRGLVLEQLRPGWRDLVERVQPMTLHGNARNPADLLELVASGTPVYASPVNDVKRARSLFAIGIFGIMTDYPAQMLFQNVQIRMPA
jgi:glycerophosphoryl diester phosphodiesterase